VIHIDGSQGEGGGQVLRTSLGLAAALGMPVCVSAIRAGRKRPGLLRQHLTSARAAAEVCDGELLGAELGSTELTLRPGAVRAGSYRFAVGSAGSAMLVLQTVLPPLLTAAGESEVVLEGGTHNPWAPPFDFVEATLAPVLARTGAELELELVRAGFYPAGGGEVRCRIRPPSTARPLELMERGAPTGRVAVVHLAHLPDSIAEREGRFLRQELKWFDGRVDTVLHPKSAGPGNALCLLLGFEQVDEVLTGFGEKQVPAKRVARAVARQAARYLGADAPVGEHLADQLMAPLAVLAGGVYRAFGPSGHAATNGKLIGSFLPQAVSLEREGDQGCLVRVVGR
jgi:RNA 3'-terminal phosphate cyclase (ATP)